MKASPFSRSVQKVFILLFVALFSIPLYIALVNAFKTSAQISAHPLALPWPLTLENIVSVLSNPNVSIVKMYLNSIVLALCGTTLCIFVSSLAAYYLARSNRQGFAKKLHGYFLLGLMVPYIIVLLPLCTLLKVLGITGNLVSLVFIFVSGSISFSVFMFTGFIKSIPKEMDEAAAIDGARPFTIFWRVLFPLLGPCTTTVGIFIGLSMWNDFLTPLLVGQVQTITVGIYTAIGPYSSDWGRVFAFVLFGSIPMIILYLLAQKQFIGGLTAGALKG